MLLIATANERLGSLWAKSLKHRYEVYEPNVTDRRSLEICLNKVNVETLLLQVELLGNDRVDDITSICDLQPNTNIIIFTSDFDDREEISAILFGAKAYLREDFNVTLLPKVIDTVNENELWVDRKFLTRLLAEIEDITRIRHKEAQELDKGIESMTPRESQIAALIATGASNKRIAEKLSISERTVKAHLGVVFRKIGISDRLQLALYINRHKQISEVWKPRSHR